MSVTLSARRQGWIPEDFLMVGFDGSEKTYGIQPHGGDRESPVVVIAVGQCPTGRLDITAQTSEPSFWTG